jgi:ArsR family transcriptional regulator
LRIIECLSEKSRNVGELASCLGKHMVKVSHHLSILRKAGLVKSNRMGRFIYYELQSGLGVSGSTGHLDLGCCRLEFSKISKKCCL